MAESEEHATAALAFFLKSGNPLLAIMAISYWPLDQPLPTELRRALAYWTRNISALTGKVATMVIQPSEALKQVPAAMGLVGERGRGHGAFAQVREEATADRLLRAMEAVLADTTAPAAKVEHIEEAVGKREGLSGSQAHRLMQKYSKPGRPRTSHVSIRAKGRKPA